MTRHVAKITRSYRHELVHGEEADFIVYQGKSGSGHWRTISSWMIPHTDH